MADVLYIFVYCSHSIMEKCWNDDREVRPTFHELKKEFDEFISHEEQYNYLIIGDARETNSSGTGGHLEPASQLQSIQ